ncbi:hypothetical protein V8G54_012168 [Vigna mungo]|uniref:Uncharacterized protein n=1 Tax=Vigna mungo TaxID=3915 RepID=A0AAQ3NTP2_VIGMU
MLWLRRLEEDCRSRGGGDIRLRGDRVAATRDEEFDDKRRGGDDGGLADLERLGDLELVAEAAAAEAAMAEVAAAEVAAAEATTTKATTTIEELSHWRKHHRQQRRGTNGATAQAGGTTKNGNEQKRPARPLAAQGEEEWESTGKKEVGETTGSTRRGRMGEHRQEWKSVDETPHRKNERARERRSLCRLIKIREMKRWQVYRQLLSGNSRQ